MVNDGVLGVRFKMAELHETYIINGLCYFMFISPQQFKSQYCCVDYAAIPSYVLLHIHPVTLTL